MPQSSYTNKDLKRFDRTPGNYTEYGDWHDVPGTFPKTLGAVDMESADSLLNKAHASLGRANQLEGETGAADVASIPQRLAALSLKGPVVDPRADFRNLTTKLHTAGLATGAAAIPGAFVGAGPLLGAASIALAAPDVARRVLMPDEDESRLGGVGEAALLASPLALKGLKGAVNSYREGRVIAAEGAARQAEAAQQAGAASKMRFDARQFEAGGGTPDEFYTKTGMNPESDAYASEGFHPNAPRSISTATPISHNTVSTEFDNFSRPSYQGLVDSLAEPEPIDSFASGPRIEQGLGNADEMSPEMRALYNRWMMGKDAPIENLNEAINPTVVRPRSMETAPYQTYDPDPNPINDYSRKLAQRARNRKLAGSK